MEQPVLMLYNLVTIIDRKNRVYEIEPRKPRLTAG